MSDLLDDYDELIHEPQREDIFELPEYVFGDTTVTVSMEPAFGRDYHVKAIRTVTLGSEQRKRVGLCIVVNEVDFRFVYKGSERLMVETLYHTTMKRAMDEAQEKMEGTFVAQEMGTPDARSYLGGSSSCQVYDER